MTPWQQPLDDFPEIELDDEWVGHLQRAMTERVGAGSFEVTRHEGRGALLPESEVKVVEPRVATRLRLVAVGGQLRPFVVGEGEPIATEIEHWNSAARTACEQLSAGDVRFDWRAVVGPPTAHASHMGPNAETRVGTLTIRTVDQLIADPIPAAFPTLFATPSGTATWRPIVVEGQTTARRFKDAHMRATRELRRLCALLSLAWQFPFTLRQAPLSRNGAELALPNGPRAELGADARELPLWLDHAWKKLDGDPKLARALGIYYEGVTLLALNHTSFALIAFVGAIETIAKTLPDRPPPQACDTCGKEKGQAVADFRRALALVVDSDNVKPLSDAVYGPRSATAHAGALHGTEDVFGLVLQPGMVGPSRETDFVWFALHPLKSAAELLLQRQLQSV